MCAPFGTTPKSASKTQCVALRQASLFHRAAQIGFATRYVPSLRLNCSTQAKTGTSMVELILHPHEGNLRYLLGQFCDQAHYDTVVAEDTDGYVASSDMRAEHSVIFKFRKQAFTQLE